MPPGSTAQAHQYDAAHTSYPHYPMTYLRAEASYPMDNPVHFSTNPANTYPGHQPVSGVPPARIEPPVASSSSAPYARSSPQPAIATEPILAQPVPSKAPEARPAIRRSYHPNPPVQRSEWVMWAGNVPSDTVHDELWRFFKQPPSQSSTRAPSPEKDGVSDESEELYDGVTSIFLISRSNCAFVNFETEAQLHKAIDRFNGTPLRPNDTRCPRLLCRVRRKDDDLKAGVGGQRGMGIHTRWVKEREVKPEERETPTPAVAPLEQLTSAVGNVSLSSDEELSIQSQKQSSTSSYASTNSSMLTRHFPKRYFILKSLTQFDLDLSVEKRLWATQKHNEGILDQAYRTSTDVYLVFSVNKSGEFYGYARMNGPILQGGHSVSWASRTSEENTSARSSLSPAAGRATRQPDSSSPVASAHQAESPNFFSPVENRLVEKSPGLLSESEIQVPETDRTTSSGANNQALRSAPAVLGPAHRQFTTDTPQPKQSLGTDQLFNAPVTAPFDTPFDLDPTAPGRARRDVGSAAESSSLAGVPEELDGDVARADDAVPTREGWGASFPIEWICTDRLPFFRTRHLRNPWNHDREIKVSRDGTELEPAIGQTLLDEWKALAAETTVDDEKPLRRGPATPTATSISAALDPRTKGGTRRS
ncbi:hypothetical protein FIBSPDRAFT_911636 [Athelia psychrophila]|uniref:YTH domain-containing protein n=1 Tax=Athelia psychrophila TaxID=1759441 RepID=A0A166H789_9AGAM|nr:hypothetical protein FIBSPDRAFT_911636 [Fibularhizoctonia sp. CBS 109695]